MSDGTPCMWMRGGTSKGAYFLASDLPRDRDRFLLRIMGSPDAKQIDGMGGATPLTSKVAVVSTSTRPGIDVDYLFLQVGVDAPLVSDGQNCGNILAGVGPFAIERGLVATAEDVTRVTIYMENTGQVAVANVPTKAGRAVYDGDAAIDGVPGTAAAIPLTFRDTAGSTCGALLPSGNRVDQVAGATATLIDNGMPVIVLDAAEFGLSGQETPATLEADTALKARLEAIRLAAAPLMNLGDVTKKTIPKLTLISAPRKGGTIATRTFIPHRCHASIGVLGAVSVATACLLPGTPASKLAVVPDGETKTLTIEHPSGHAMIQAETRGGEVLSAAIIRTARKLFDGRIFD